MTGHFRITGNSFADGKITVDGEPFPFKVIGVRWRLEQDGFPVLTLDIAPDRLTIEFPATQVQREPAADD